MTNAIPACDRTKDVVGFYEHIDSCRLDTKLVQGLTLLIIVMIMMMMMMMMIIIIIMIIIMSAFKGANRYILQYSHCSVNCL